MALLKRAREMPRQPVTVGWHLGIGHIVIVHRDGLPKDTQGIVVQAWLDGSIAVMVPDLNQTLHCTLDDLEVVGVMPRFTSAREDAQ